METVRTIAEDFAEYTQFVLADAPDGVRDFAQAAFYAGAGAMLDSLDKIGRTADTPAMGIAIMRRLRDEFADFASERVVRHIATAMGIDKIVRVELHVERRSTSGTQSGGKD